MTKRARHHVSAALAFGMVPFLTISPAAAREKIRIAASQSAYGDIVGQIAGTAMQIDVVQSQQPVRSPLKLTADYDFVVCDLRAVDDTLRRAAQQRHTPVIAVSGENQKIVPWEDVAAMSALARDVARELTRLDPGNQAAIARNLAAFESSVERLRMQMAEITAYYAGSGVILLHGSFAGLADALKFKVQGRALPPAPEAAEIKAAVDIAKHTIDQHDTSLLIYDRDAKSALVDELIDYANQSGVSVVGLTEGMPSGLHYQQWMVRQLNTIRGGLNEAAP